MSAWTVAGRRVVVTGASSGLGRVTALRLAGLGAEVVVASRSRERLDPVAAEIRSRGGRAHVVEIDLAAPASVVDAAARLVGPLTVLVHNAGRSGGPRSTFEGFEPTMAANFLGPFLLTAWLAPSLRSSDIRPRIVVVSSDAHRGASAAEALRLRGRRRSVTGYPEYRGSKLAMVLWSRELARRLPDIDVSCVHPGMVATPMWDRLPPPLRGRHTRRMLTPEEGARTQVRCASDPGLTGSSGHYWARGEIRPPSDAARDEDLAHRLWEATERELAPWMPPLPFL